MNTKQNAGKHSMDTLKLFFSVSLLVAALVANSWYADVDVALRSVAGIAVLLLSAILAWRTCQGRTFVQFVKDARMEMRKVVWPTRQEVSRNTLLVVIIVVLMSDVLWGMDTMFAWLIAKFVG